MIGVHTNSFELGDELTNYFRVRHPTPVWDRNRTGATAHLLSGERRGRAGGTARRVSRSARGEPYAVHLGWDAGTRVRTTQAGRASHSARYNDCGAVAAPRAFRLETPWRCLKVTSSHLGGSRHLLPPVPPISCGLVPLCTTDGAQRTCARLLQRALPVERDAVRRPHCPMRVQIRLAPQCESRRIAAYSDGTEAARSPCGSCTRHPAGLCSVARTRAAVTSRAGGERQQR